MSDYTPEQLTLSSIAEYVTAIDNLCKMAEHNLYLFEKDFDRLGFNSETRFNTLRSFLLSSPVHKLHLLAHDASHLTTKCPRMMNLLHQFSGNMFIYQTPKNLKHIATPFSVADDEHLVQRYHFDDARGLFSIQDSANAHILKARFMEMWAVSHPAPSSTRLGL
ncbi:MAG: hypothetical protein HOO95_06375 [Gallionella sp.]|nr:hypothetical protein [Gallionella sp.]